MPMTVVGLYFDGGRKYLQAVSWRGQTLVWDEAWFASFDPDSEVRVGAVTALADYPDHPEIVTVLREAILSRDDSLAIRARTLLADYIARRGGGPAEDTPETEEEPGFWDKYFGWLPHF